MFDETECVRMTVQEWCADVAVEKIQTRVVVEKIHLRMAVGDLSAAVLAGWIQACVTVELSPNAGAQIEIDAWMTGAGTKGVG